MAKALFGAVCGAVIGGAILVALGMNGFDALWPALGVGVICGLCLRMNAHPSSGSYVNGALAAIAVLVAVVGGKLVLVKMLTDAEQPAVTQMVAEEIEVTAQAADPAKATEGQQVDSGEAGEENKEAATEESEPAEADNPAADQEQPAPKPAPVAVSLDALTVAHDDGARSYDFSPIDAIYLIVGALIAYQIGKGEGHQQTTPQQPTPQPKSEPESDSGSDS